MYRHTMALPWSLMLGAMSTWASIIMSAFCAVGASPAGYVSVGKMRELSSVIEHMHIREDLYRKAIKELQDELDQREVDKKKALRKLRLTKERMATLEGKEEGLHGQDPTLLMHESESPPSESSFGLHISMGTLLTAVWWLYQTNECSAMQRKVLFSILFPLLWMYILSFASRPPIPVILLQNVSWFLIGLVAAHALTHVP